MSRELKDSGIPWIGEIPKEWTIGRMKNYFHLHGRIGWNGLRSEEFEEESYAYLVTGQDFVAKDIDWKKCYQIRKERYDEDEYIQLKEGDILVTKDGTIGKVAIVSNLDKPACLNSGIFVIKQYEPKHYNSNYLYWLLVAPLLKTYNDFINLGGTTIIHLYQNVFERMPLVLPLLAEQQAIADFLDRKCAEVDEMIGLQEQIIEELKAYKQSVITEAVTKGLNPDAPMRDSGIEWIGEIPEHWEVKRLKNIFKLKTGTTPDGFDIVNEDSEIIPWFTPSDISDDCCELHQSERKLYKSEVGEIELFPKGSLMFVGIGASAGKLGYSHILGYSNQQITALIPDNCNGKYYYYFLIADRKRLRDNAFFTTLPIINNGYLSQNKIVYPPIAEQQAIVDYLDEKCADIDSLIQTKQAKIDSLKEYKKSIIYEYVTGKREVE